MTASVKPARNKAPARLALLLIAATHLASCASSGPEYRSLGSSSIPRITTWRCDGGTTMRVERVGDAVKVQSPRGTELTLPASPPGSRERYGEGLYALVLNGREALWFRTGKSPLDCKR